MVCTCLSRERRDDQYMFTSVAIFYGDTTGMYGK